MSYDIDGDPFLNPGIREVVRFLCARGYVTTDSGDGQTTYWPDCDLSVPFVHIRSEQGHMVIDGSALHRLLSSDECPFTLTPDFDVQVSYSFVDGVALVSVFGVVDETAERDEELIQATRDAIRASAEDPSEEEEP